MNNWFAYFHKGFSITPFNPSRLYTRACSGFSTTLPSETIVGASLNTDAVVDRLNEPE